MIVKGGMEGRREEEEGGAGEEVRETKKKGIAEEKRTGFPDIGGLFLSSFMGTERKTRALILPSGPTVSRTQPEARSQADGSYTSGLITSNLEISPQSSAEPSLPPSLPPPFHFKRSRLYILHLFSPPCSEFPLSSQSHFLLLWLFLAR